MAQDFLSIFWWWFVLFSLGAVFFPITSYLFPKFIDRGYPFAKIVGILLLSYGFFIAGHIHILLTVQTLLCILFLFGGASIALAFHQKERFTHVFKQVFVDHWMLVVFEESLFFLSLAAWSYIRGFAPEIHGLEKFMDFGFVNSILTNQTLPPLDMWLTKAPDYTGYFINYYYFGHLILAVLTRLSSLDSVVTYNLMIAAIFAFTVIGGFSIGANLQHIFALFNKDGNKMKTMIIAGIISGYLLALGGNLHTIYTLFQPYKNEAPQPIWRLGLGCPAPTDQASQKPCFSLLPDLTHFPNAYWYPNATRFIPYTIHEFPIYSFVVSDLHGHVSDIPFVLLLIAFLLSIVSKVRDHGKVESGKWKVEKNDKKHVEVLREHPEQGLWSLKFELVFIGLLLSVMYMTNAWDGAIYLGLTGLVLLAVNYISFSQQTERKNGILFDVFGKTTLQSVLIGISFYIFNRPFSQNFVPFVHGVGVVGGYELLDSLGLIGKLTSHLSPAQPKDVITLGPFLFEKGKNATSPLYMLITLWGFFYYCVIGYVGFIVIPAIRKKVNGATRWTINHLNPVDIFVLLLIAISTGLLIFPEFFYMKDIYPMHYRANTMFKLGYQAFMMLQLTSAFIFLRILYKATRRPIFSFLWIVGFFFCFLLVAIYPYFAVDSYYGSLKTYKGINGLEWLHQQYPDDFEGISHLRKEINTGSLKGPQSVILEAQGDSYTDYARISANTGLPTVIGWPVHEWLWRGTYDEAGKRIPLVELMYTSSNPTDVKNLLDKYNVSYVFVGSMERQKYPQLTEEVFKQLGTVVFEKGDTRIYKIR